MSRDRTPAEPRIAPGEGAAGGLPAVASSLRHVRRAGMGRALAALSVVNQQEGFDCPGCAWPEGRERAWIEFCENGAKAVAHEATRKRVDGRFFARWSAPALREQSGYWLEQQGRLAEPVIRRRGQNHYEPLEWDEAFETIGRGLRELDEPDQAIFYTSGRTSNEAAFLYQLFARRFGTNNLPDCSNMCHESSGRGLGEQIGVGKGTVSLEDFELADLILVIGQNPGTNHPRMLTTLSEAARRGCAIVSINPLVEKGLTRFKHPQELRGLVGAGTKLASRFVQVRVGGDIALLKGVMRAMLALDDERGDVLDRAFIEQHTTGFDAFAADLCAQDPARLSEQSGISEQATRELALLYAGAERVIACWAMGLTQHRFGVENVQEVTNLLLMRGNLGVPGAGVCPVRGHSNVQGDRTMGIWEAPPPEFLSRLGAEFDFTPPAEHGTNTVGAIAALASGRARFFMAMGGNFAAAAPDTAHTEQALARCGLAVHVATKLNRTHVVAGEESILLPCLGRTERDAQAAGEQFVTVEDSMSAVHRSQGWLDPVADELRSEPAIVAGIARATLGYEPALPWQEWAADYDRIRDHIANVIPGFEDFNRRVRDGGFVLPSGARTRAFDTPSGRAHFVRVAVPQLDLEGGQYLMMTLRSHDQFNTTVYGHDDRYRGVYGERRVVFLNPEDMAHAGFVTQELVDLTSHFEGETRTAERFRVVPYQVPSRCAVTYFPEANPLVPLGAFADKSATPAYKSVVITIQKSSSECA